MKPGAKPRAAAARALAAVLGGATLERALAAEVDEVAERDHSLLRELSYGTLRLWPRLHGLLDQLLDRPLRRRDAELRTLLLVGLYQLAELRVPAHAAVSATVDATAVLGRKSARGLVNAVLRRYQREQAELHAALAPSAQAALPDWLWRELGEHWPQQRNEIAAAAASRPPLTLRANQQRASRESALERLEDAGIEASAGTLSPTALTLAEGRDVHSIPGFSEGDISVQDEAAQLAALLLAPQPGEKILDACAAPGGKACHLLELEPACELLACDVAEERLELVSDNAARLQLRLRTLCADLSTPPQEVVDAGPFDAMLLDVPCSASGVIRRHPDIKLLRRESDSAGFAAQQMALLTGCWPLLKAGGRLLYVTCSLLPQENADIVEAFLASTADAELAALDVPGSVPCDIGYQVLPRAHGPDGLYFALLHKRA